MVYLRKHEALLKSAKNIFGDIVAEAYLVYEYYAGDSDEDIENEFRSSVNSLTTKDNSISYDGCKIALEFTNGKKVSFGNSEWAHIEKLDSNTKIY